MVPFARLRRRSQRSARTSAPVRLGGADAEPGALTTLELVGALGSRPSGLQPIRRRARVALAVGAAAEAAPTIVEDPYAADRFTVDVAEWGEASETAAEPTPLPSRTGTTSSVRLLARLLLTVGLSLLVFHHSLASVGRTVAHGSILVYLLAVPLFAALAAAAQARRPGFRPAGGVGRLDVALGVVICGGALGLTAVVGPSLSGVYPVWRLDLLTLWAFLVGANVVAFGRRQVLGAWLFWVVMLLVWPFPMRLVNAAAGSATGGAVVLVLLVLAILAYGHQAHDHPRWRVLGSSAAVAGLVLLGCEVATHPPRMLWPPVAAATVGLAWWVSRSSGLRDAPVPERRVRGTLAWLVGLSVVGLVVLPVAPRPVAISTPTGITALSTGPIAMPGWATLSSQTLPPQPYFGNQSSWQRVGMRQGVSGVGPEAGGRDLLVDVVTTPRPQTLDLYPVVTTYRMGTLSATPDATVDLGHAVEGSLYRGIDPKVGAFTLLTFSWQLPVDMSIVLPYHGSPARLTQRMTFIALDDHESDAPVPQPSNATLDGIGTAAGDLVHGAAARPGLPDGDVRLLTDAARALVQQRLTGG